MRRLKSNFRKSLVIPRELNNENLIFFGKYKHYSCVASAEPETGDIYVSVSNGTKHIDLTKYETVEILDKFDIDECEMIDIESPAGDWVTRYFKAKARVL